MINNEQLKNGERIRVRGGALQTVLDHGVSSLFKLAPAGFGNRFNRERNFRQNQSIALVYQTGKKCQEKNQKIFIFF
jgi:hypothetical protein